MASSRGSGPISGKTHTSHRRSGREYVEWIGEARREATRASRIAQGVEWIGEGKTRNWKYQAC